MKHLSARAWFLLTGGLLVILQALDGYITTAVVTTGVGREANGLLIGVVDNSWFWLAKVAVTMAVIGVLYWRIKGKDGDYRRATKVLAGLGVFYTTIVVWNAYWLLSGTVVWAGL